MANGNGTETVATKYLGWRIFSGAVVVILALTAIVVSLLFVLDHYDSATGDASTSASSVVAVLTPVMAGIIGVAGLFFGISATASSRGLKSEASIESNQAVIDTARHTAEAIKDSAATNQTVALTAQEAIATAREASTPASGASPSPKPPPA
jgi:uncharacterized membrane protein YcjF (UPF0283 family)